MSTPDPQQQIYDTRLAQFVPFYPEKITLLLKLLMHLASKQRLETKDKS